MDEGPFRMQPSPERRGAGRPASAPATRQSEQPQPATEPRTVSSQRVEADKPKKAKSLTPLWVALSVILLGVIAWLVWTNTQNTTTSINEDQYQAVFFSNGNVYFGDLQDVSNDYYKMTGVYYPQTSTDTDAEVQQPTSDQSSITLLKLGDAIHGPDDEMMIAKDQVLFFQNLRSDSQVSRLIDGQNN